MKTNYGRIVLIWFVTALILTACGGGGGGTTNNNQTANTPPISNAGIIQNVLVGTAVTLNGSASSDANGDPLTYSWTLTSKPAGSTASLTGATSAAPTFTADAAGTYVATLTVNDGTVNSSSTTVTITAITTSTTGSITSASASATTLLVGTTASYDYGFINTNGLPTGGTITVVYPSGFNVAGAARAGSFGSWYPIQSISGQTITYSIGASGALNTGAWRSNSGYLTTAGIINPSAAGTYNLQIYTSTDPTPVNVPVTIQ